MSEDVDSVADEEMGGGGRCCCRRVGEKSGSVGELVRGGGWIKDEEAFGVWEVVGVGGDEIRIPA